MTDQIPRDGPKPDWVPNKPLPRPPTRPPGNKPEIETSGIKKQLQSLQRSFNRLQTALSAQYENFKGSKQGKEISDQVKKVGELLKKILKPESSSEEEAQESLLADPSELSTRTHTDTKISSVKPTSPLAHQYETYKWDPSDPITHSWDPSNSVIRDSFTFDGITYGEEVVSRYTTLNEDERVQGRDWLTSNYFRELIKNHGYEKACQLWKARPVNMRYQELEGVHDSGFLRLGVISDVRNGSTNLRELKAVQALDNEAKKAWIENRKIYLNAVIDSTKSNGNQKESIERAKAELDSLDATIAEREQNLSAIFLHLLAAQVEKKDPVPGSTFTLTHLSLLNPKTNRLDNSGWYHNEMNAAIDMAEIFRIMHGKTIQLGDRGPEIEGGVIYLPSSNSGAVELRTAFFNTSAQGHEKNNDTHQQALNNESLARLRSDPHQNPAQLEILSGILGRKKFGYQTSVEAGNLLRELGALSICCASAKDRTGVVASLLIQEKIKAPKKAQRYFANRSIEIGGTASHIVWENTSAVLLKINPLAGRLPGQSTLAYLYYNLKQGIQAVNERL